MATRNQRLSATVAAGTATITFVQRGANPFVITQVSEQLQNAAGAAAAAPLGATCTLYYNGAFVTALIPTGDAAGGDPPIVLQPGIGDQISIVWTGCTNGQIGTALIIYDDGV